MNKRLRSLIDRAERLIAEREEANEGLRDLRKECKSDGYEAAQIMKLAQLSYDDKKRAKLATANETLALYNRESGLGLVLGLDESEAVLSTREGDDGREATSSRAGREATASDPVQKSEAPAKAATAAIAGEREVTAPDAASDTPSPAGDGNSSDVGSPQAASQPSPRDVPAGDPDHDWERKDSAATFFVGHAVAGGKEPHPNVPDTAMTQAVIARCAPDAPLEPPAFLRRGTPENGKAMGKAS